MNPNQTKNHPNQTNSNFIIVRTYFCNPPSSPSPLSSPDAFPFFHPLQSHVSVPNRSPPCSPNSTSTTTSDERKYLEESYPDVSCCCGNQLPMNHFLLTPLWWIGILLYGVGETRETRGWRNDEERKSELLAKTARRVSGVMSA